MRKRVLFIQVAAVIALTAAVAACSSNGPAAVSTTFRSAAIPEGSWPYPDADIGNTRVAPDSKIDAGNVSGLKEAWAFKLAGTAAAGVSGAGALTAAPVVQDGVVYIQDEDANVYALQLATGTLKWEYQVNVPEQTGPGPDGVAVADGKMGIVYALNARTGALLWQTPVGEHNGHDSDALLALEHKLTIKLPYTMLPGSLGGILSNMAVADGSVYVATLDVPIVATKLSTADGDASGGAASGEIESLSLATGKVEWDVKVPTLPLGATTVSNDLVFTSLFTGELLALNRNTGAIVYRHQLPTSANAPIAVFGNTVLVPAGGSQTSAKGGGGNPQLVAYTVP